MKNGKDAKAKVEGKDAKSKSSTDKHSAGHSAAGKETAKPAKKK